MTSETLARIQRLLDAGTPRVVIDTATLKQLLDAATPSGLRAQLTAAAAEALPDAVRQRDAALAELAAAEGWIEALHELLSRRIDAMKARERGADLTFAGASA